jgi:hypothetical protein
VKQKNTKKHQKKPKNKEKNNEISAGKLEMLDQRKRLKDSVKEIR